MSKTYKWECEKCGSLFSSGKEALKHEETCDIDNTRSLGWLLFWFIVIPPIGYIWLIILWLKGLKIQ